MAKKILRKYFSASIIVLILDLTWIFLIMGDFYQEQLSGFLRPDTIPIWSAILAWLLIPLGIVLFVDRISKNIKESLIYGAIYGLILYGVYDFTNYATLANWTLSLVVADVLWGVFLCSISSCILKFIFADKQKST